MIRMVTRAPPPMLAPFVKAMWHFESDLPHARERILPSGSMQILINLHEDELRTYRGEGYNATHRTRGAVICGAFAHHFGIDTAEQRAVMGVTFHPGGAYPFFAAPPSAIGAAHVELDALWGATGATLRERLLDVQTAELRLQRLEAILIERAVRPLERGVVAHALAELGAGSAVGEVTSRLSMTAKRFIARFNDEVGLTPKRFSRVVRFQRVLSSIETGRSVEWARVAAASGYFDQAHLIHDFRAFSGLTPTSYRPRSPSDRNHVAM